MIIRKILLLILITFSGVLPGISGSFNYTVMNAVYDWKGGKKIYRIGCETNCTTMFVLPPGELIADIIEPTGEWIINCDNKRFVYVVPAKSRIHTSLDLITKSSKIYSFILEELSGRGQARDVVKKVNIIEGLSRLKMERQDVREKLDIDEWAPERINDKYRIKDKHFYIDRVEDNGIVTRIYIPRSRIRPAIFTKDKGKRKKLEPVRYIDYGDFYIVHKILGKGEMIVLKSGKSESLIRHR